MFVFVLAVLLKLLDFDTKLLYVCYCVSTIALFCYFSFFLF